MHACIHPRMQAGLHTPSHNPRTLAGLIQALYGLAGGQVDAGGAAKELERLREALDLCLRVHACVGVLMCSSNSQQ